MSDGPEVVLWNKDFTRSVSWFIRVSMPDTSRFSLTSCNQPTYHNLHRCRFCLIFLFNLLRGWGLWVLAIEAILILTHTEETLRTSVIAFGPSRSVEVTDNKTPAALISGSVSASRHYSLFLLWIEQWYHTISAWFIDFAQSSRRWARSRDNDVVKYCTVVVQDILIESIWLAKQHI